MNKTEKFCGRIMFTEPEGVRRATLFDENMGFVQELHGVHEVPQHPDATEHELRIFVNTLAPPGVRVQKNEDLGFVFDFLK